MRKFWHDENPSLVRQAVVIAMICVLGDGALLVMRLTTGPVSWRVWLAVPLVLLVDLALALPARTSGHVAVAHAVVRFMASALLVAPGISDVGNASGMVVAGFRAGAWIRTPAVLFALVLGVLGEQAARGFDGVALTLMELGTNTALPWLVGRYVADRRGYVAELEQQAEEERRTAEEAVARALAEERGTIARDLHDTISHHVSAIGMHAGAARLGLATTRTVGLEQALGQVESSSREAMADLRRMLALLHGSAGRDGMRQPGLGDLDRLVDGSRAAGLEVRLTVEGLEPGRLPGSLDIAAYRIAQEMLTNALRHGAAGVVELELRQDGVQLELSCRNPLPERPRPSGGTHLGLEGIRHRAGLFDGRAEHGAQPDGRTWRTVVTFPLETPS